MSAMSVVNSGTNSVVVDIVADSASRVIERAVKKYSHLQLEFSSGAGDDGLSGRLCDARRDALVMDFKDVCPNAAWRSACCEGSFTLDGDEYLFSSNVLDFSVSGRRGAIEIVRPDVLRTWQRRRFMRATVADSSYVALCPPNEFGNPLFEGKMLNVSEDGLACRVDRAAVECYEIGERLGARFTLGSAPGMHTLNAVIISKTPGGTEGTIILGIQFDTRTGPREAQARLAEALQTYV